MGQQYLRHVTGMACLLAWLTRWERMGQSLRMRGPVVRLTDLVSQRIGLGWPTRLTARAAPFLAFQREERTWAEAIHWERAVLALDEQRVFLIGAPERAGDGNTVDIPTFALGVALDVQQKATLLGAYPTLEGRSMYRDEDLGQWVVSRGALLWRLPLEVVPSIHQVLRDEDLRADRSFKDMIESRIARTNTYVEPQFRGERPVVSEEYRELVEPFDIKKMPRVE